MPSMKSAANGCSYFLNGYEGVRNHGDLGGELTLIYANTGPTRRRPAITANTPLAPALASRRDKQWLEHLLHTAGKKPDTSIQR